MGNNKIIKFIGVNIMKELLINGIPYLIAVAFLEVAITLKPYVQKALQAIEAKAQEILGQTVYEKAKTFAVDEIIALLQQFPANTIEDITAEAIVVIENRFGVKYLTKEEIKAIVASAIAYIQSNINVLNDAVSDGVNKAQQKYLTGEIQSTDRKQTAIESVLLRLQQSSIPINDKLKSVIDDKIESSVLISKSSEEQKLQEQNILQQQNITLQTQAAQLTESNTKLQQELTELKQKLADIQSTATVPTVQ